MAEEEKDKKEEEKDKKLEFLKREDIRTMEKDIARLREGEAGKERERIAKLKTSEELEKEKMAQEKAKKEAQERQRAEEEAKRKQEELKKLKEDRERKETIFKREETAREEMRKEEMKEKMKETQRREEEERKKFMERVAGKPKETPVPTPAPPAAPPKPPIPPAPKPIPAPKPKPAPIPAPTPTPAPPKLLASPTPPAPAKKPPIAALKLPKLPKISGVFPKKPSLLDRIWVRVIVSLLILAVLAVDFTFWYWYLVVREEIKTPPTIEQQKEEATTTPEAQKPIIHEMIIDRGYAIPPEPREISVIIIHSVYNALSEDTHSVEGVIEEYKKYDVAAHYLITQEGDIYQTAPDEAVAYHAGISQLPDGRTDVNGLSIGIELIYTETETPTAAQYLALAKLVNYLAKEHNIAIQNILGHKDVAPRRKTDPWNFNWQYFQSLLK